MPKIDLDKLMQDIVYINNQLTGLNMLLSNKKQTLAKYFAQSGERQVKNDDVTCFQQERTKITYDIPAIEQNIPKSIYSKFITKTYTIPDWPRFVQLCKDHGISPNRLKPYISVVKEVNQKALSRMYDHKEIDLSDLSGCYEATVSKSIVLRFNDTDGKIPIQPEKEQ